MVCWCGIQSFQFALLLAVGSYFGYSMGQLGGLGLPPQGMPPQVHPNPLEKRGTYFIPPSHQFSETTIMVNNKEFQCTW